MSLYLFRQAASPHPQNPQDKREDCSAKKARCIAIAKRIHSLNRSTSFAKVCREWMHRLTHVALFLIGISWPLCGHAHDPYIYLEAACIDYLGDQIVLSGNVLVQHPIGSLSSQRAILSFSGGSLASQALCQLDLSDSVMLFFADQDTLRCESAHLDLSTFEGTFLGSPDGPLARYQGTLRQGAWELEGDRLSFKLLPPSNTKDRKYSLGYLQAEGHVTIRTQEGLLAFGNLASYVPGEPLPSSELGVALEDRFTLLADPHLSTLCKLQDAQGNWIEGTQVLLTPALGVGNITQPSGCVYFASTTATEPMFFNADDLEWDYRGGHLKLHRHVRLQHPTFGNAYCEDTVHLVTTLQGSAVGHWELAYLESFGTTELSHFALPTVGSGTMKCRGNVRADMLSGKVSFQAQPHDKVLYAGDAGLLAAERVGFHYHPSSRRVEHFFAKQQVQMLRHLADSTLDDAPLQGALAHRLDFFPEKRELLLRGSRSSPVLFTDTLQNLSISSHKVVAKIDAHGRESIRGLGAVRLSFNEMEANHMKYLFSMEP